MKTTKIQWCDGTINPVMGCDGCELYPTSESQVLRTVERVLVEEGVDQQKAREAMEACSVNRTSLMLQRDDIAKSLAERFCNDPRSQRKLARKLTNAIAGNYRCYASQLHRTWNTHGTNPGYAPVFEQPTQFPGRMVQAARAPSLIGVARPDKPWLGGAPRLWFISDMGDALSRNIPFEYLQKEIVEVVTSEEGQGHLWLWLSKRPGRMAQFGRWLARRDIPWPDNLVAMTTITSRKSLSRIDQLRQVPAKYRGLSIEPLWEGIVPDLSGIDWVIVGGESGGSARRFDLEWAESLQEQCAREGVAFFLKQLGRHPFRGGVELNLADRHGGDWSEWPEHLRVREIPQDWRAGLPVMGKEVRDAAA